MWRGLTQLFTSLAELADLLREQNSLLRELIHSQAHRPARTPLSRHSQPLPAPPPIRQYTEQDVHDTTPAARLSQDESAAAERQYPWRTPAETLAALEEAHQSPPRPK